MGADREPFFPEWGVGMAKHSHFLYCYSPRSSFALRASALSFSLNIRMACPARSLKGWVVFVACAGGVNAHGKGIGSPSFAKARSAYCRHSRFNGLLLYTTTMLAGAGRSKPNRP